MMDKRKLVIVGVVIVLLYFVYTFFFSKPVIVTIVGTGKVKVQPTQASMVVTVANSGVGAAGVLADNGNLTQKIISSARKLGVLQADMDVSYAQMTPTDLGKGQVFYQAVSTIGLTLKDLKKFNQVINQLYANGAYSVGNIVFTTSDPQLTEKQAVGSAIVDAKNRANELARSLNKSVGRMVSITTSEVGGSGAVSGQAVSSSASSPNQIEIDRQASIVFELR